MESEDYYMENGFLVFNAKYLLERGYCCGSKCRHCPYHPPFQSGNTHVAEHAEPALPSSKDADSSSSVQNM